MYPDINPYESGYLDVGDGHTLYYELCGNPDGMPAVFLHGGPGGGIHEDMRRLFNPDYYKVILFDQRGAGKSTPFASLDNNSIDHLVGDVEKMRVHLGIDKWLVTGGSWGSTLSLLYAIAYPDRVTGLVVTGIFFADQKGVRWLAEEGGASEIMPEWFAPYRDHIPPERRKGGLAQAYYEIMMNGSDAEVLEATRLFTVWDTSILEFDIPFKRIRDVEKNPGDSVPLAKIFFHFVHHFYTDENRTFILDSVGLLGHIPCTIIHGRYDLICPVNNAFELHKAFPGSTLFVLDKTGHTTRSPDLADKFIETTDLIAGIKR